MGTHSVSNNHTIAPLPSLQALRVLEAAVRRQSYSDAARELGLTHGAVSRQVDALETWAGAPLFARAGRRMMPTAAASSLVTRTREALRILEEAFGHPVLPRHAAGLRISTTPAIARLWLVPRLPALHRDHPGLIAAIEVSSALDAGASDSVDAGIRYGPGGWPGVESRLLGRERLFPVAAPHLIAPGADWRAAPRIGTPFQSWRRWFDETAPDLDRQDGAALELPDAALALDAAIQGLGVALARERLVAPLLRTGILVRLSPDAVEDIYSYWFVRPPTRTSKQIDALLEWLLNQFADGATG